jgi:hypothetical protein
MGALATFLKVLTKVFAVVPLAVQVAETMGNLFSPGQKTGPQKLAAVQAAVKDSILASELVIGKDIIDEDLLNQGITKIANGAVDVMNAVKPKGA